MSSGILYRPSSALIAHGSRAIDGRVCSTHHFSPVTSGLSDSHDRGQLGMFQRIARIHLVEIVKLRTPLEDFGTHLAPLTRSDNCHRHTPDLVAIRIRMSGSRSLSIVPSSMAIDQTSTGGFLLQCCAVLRWGNCSACPMGNGGREGGWTGSRRDVELAHLVFLSTLRGKSRG